MINNGLINSCGWGSTLAAIYLNISQWLFSMQISQILTIIISLSSILFVWMKIYDQYLVTKKRKQEIKEENDSNNNDIG